MIPFSIQNHEPAIYYWYLFLLNAEMKRMYEIMEMELREHLY